MYKIAHSFPQNEQSKHSKSIWQCTWITHAFYGFILLPYGSGGTSKISTRAHPNRLPLHPRPKREYFAVGL